MDAEDAAFLILARGTKIYDGAFLIFAWGAKEVAVVPDAHDVGHRPLGVRLVAGTLSAINLIVRHLLHFGTTSRWFSGTGGVGSVHEDIAKRPSALDSDFWPDNVDVLHNPWSCTRVQSLDLTSDTPPPAPSATTAVNCASLPTNQPGSGTRRLSPFRVAKQTRSEER